MNGKQLRDRRIKLGLTQEGLAEKLFVARNTIARWEREEMSMPSSLLDAALETVERQSAGQHLGWLFVEIRRIVDRLKSGEVFIADRPYWFGFVKHELQFLANTCKGKDAIEAKSLQREFSQFYATERRSGKK